LTKLNGIIPVTEKLFSLDMQCHTKNNSKIIKDLEKKSTSNKKRKDVIQKDVKKNKGYKIKFSKSSQDKST